jgi:hypothetical protein
MQRPGGVTAIAILDFIGAGFLVLGGIAVFFGGAFLGAVLGGGASRSGAGAGVGMMIGAALGIFMLVIAGIAGFVGWGLWSLKEWARIVQIVLAGLGIFRSLFALMAIAHGHFLALPFTFAWLAFYGWVIYYLIQPEVKAAFSQQPVVAYMPPAPPAP